jgi:motility quorum-sensing regulator/GCU-specific mRNA interferase toxin
MEKRRPHFPLNLVQQLANDPAHTRFTRVALDGAAELGFDTAMIRTVVMGLRREDFYKSMTTYADTAIWQDVYRPTVNGVPLYVKLTVYTEENLLVVSFKRR